MKNSYKTLSNWSKLKHILNGGVGVGVGVSRLVNCQQTAFLFVHFGSWHETVLQVFQKGKNVRFEGY